MNSQNGSSESSRVTVDGWSINLLAQPQAIDEIIEAAARREGADADRALERISDSGARLCFIALGVPKQELFAARAVRRRVPVGFACIGTALDFLGGAQVRAPAVMRDRGMEWLSRLGTNPRRLEGRYMSGAMVLAELELRSLAAMMSDPWGRPVAQRTTTGHNHGVHDRADRARQKGTARS